MDMQMPAMDGVEACEIIMKRQGLKATVVFVTAHASEEF
jgi:CheY-like chemotaxis protein